MQININNIAELQQLQQICKEHPECKNCPLYSIQGHKNFICENAVVRLSAQTEQSEQTSS